MSEIIFSHQIDQLHFQEHRMSLICYILESTYEEVEGTDMKLIAH